MDIDEEEEDMEADAATNEEEEEQEPEGEVSHSSSFIHNNGGGIKCYPCPSVRINVRLSKRYPLSESNTFDQNFMKLGHIVMYHVVFIKFDNGPYRTMLSVVMAL